MGGSTQVPLPGSSTAAIPAAAYVRMSTEHQQYSTENQLDRIKEYTATPSSIGCAHDGLEVDPRSLLRCSVKVSLPVGA